MKKTFKVVVEFELEASNKKLMAEAEKAAIDSLPNETGCCGSSGDFWIKRGKVYPKGVEKSDGSDEELEKLGPFSDMDVIKCLLWCFPLEEAERKARELSQTNDGELAAQYGRVADVLLNAKSRNEERLSSEARDALPSLPGEGALR
jgi:hypothetical protein